MYLTRRILFIIWTTVAIIAQDRSAGGLPVKRVVLYKNGVGYFEHVGLVQGNQDVTIPFTSGQLNDVLNSLTVLDLNGGRIAGVGYASQAPIDQQLGDLRLPVGEKASLNVFLSALRGAKVEIRSGTAVITGRLLSVEQKTRTSANGATIEVDNVSLITDAGELRTTEVSPSFSVKLLEKGLPGKVDRYLDLMASGRAPDERRMVVSTEGTGERSLFVSYISEVPVWKSTYRIVLNGKERKEPLLQGWAIVDNTVGQDWDRVSLSLVAGAPQSFVQNISQPYYARRPVVPVSGAMNFAPQTYENTIVAGGGRLAGVVRDPSGTVIRGARVTAFDGNNNAVGQAYSDTSGHYSIDGLSNDQLRIEIVQPGFQTAQLSASAGVQKDVTLNVGSASNSVSVDSSIALNGRTDRLQRTDGMNLGTGIMLGRAPAIGVGSGGGVGMGSGGGVGGGVFRVAAQAQELGDLFEYKLKEPITIRKNTSALVPIVQSAIGAEKVSVWNEAAGMPRPTRALWLTNTAGVTLDGGSFSVLEENTFAGEGVFEAIRPAEKRLAGYAIDLALNVTSKLDTGAQRIARVRIGKGVMTQEFELHEKKTYTFRNEDTLPRTVVVEHPLRSGYELRGDLKPTETTNNLLRFRLAVDSKQTAALPVEEVRKYSSGFQVAAVSSAQLATLVEGKTIDATIEAALKRVVVQRDVKDDLDRQIGSLNASLQSIYNDQERLRENMKALKGTAEEKQLTQRYTQQLNEQENQLVAIRKEIADTTAKRDTEQAKLNQIIQGLVFDVKL